MDPLSVVFVVVGVTALLALLWGLVATVVGSIRNYRTLCRATGRKLSYWDVVNLTGWREVRYQNFLARKLGVDVPETPNPLPPAPSGPISD